MESTLINTCTASTVDREFDSRYSSYSFLWKSPWFLAPSTYVPGPLLEINDIASVRLEEERVEDRGLRAGLALNVLGGAGGVLYHAAENVQDDH